MDPMVHTHRPMCILIGNPLTDHLTAYQMAGLNLGAPMRSLRDFYRSVHHTAALLLMMPEVR